MLSALDIIDLNRTDPAAARREALAVLNAVEERIGAADPDQDHARDDSAVLALVAAGILTADDIAQHDVDIAAREHRAERRETGVSARDLIDGRKSREGK